jgi:hypothetical protein
MQVIFETQSRDANELRHFADARIRFAFRRLGWLVSRARVQFADINGPRGGVDKRCRLLLSTDGAGQVVFTSMARDWRGALDEVLAGAARNLMRNLRRQRARSRPCARVTIDHPRKGEAGDLRP